MVATTLGRDYLLPPEHGLGVIQVFGHDAERMTHSYVARRTGLRRVTQTEMVRTLRPELRRGAADLTAALVN